MTELALPPASRSRRTRRRLAWLVGLAVAGVAAVLLAPSVAGLFIARSLEPMLGGSVTIASAKPVDWGGQWLIKDLRVQAPGWRGPAGEVLWIEQAVARVDRGALWRGEVRLLSLSIDGMTVRIAEDANNAGRVNVRELSTESSGGGEAVWPAIDVAGLRIESGEVDGDRWSERGSRWFGGVVATEADAPDRHDLTLIETDPQRLPIEGGIVLKGWFDTLDLAAELRLQDLELDPESLRIAPPSVVAWCRELELDGLVREFTVAWRPEQPFDADLIIDSLTFRLPDLGGEPWVRFEAGKIETSVPPPLMRVNRGAISIKGDELSLTGIEGSLGEAPGSIDVPFSMEFSIDLGAATARGLNWSQRGESLEEVAKSAAFTLALRVRDFESLPLEQPDDRPTATRLDLPLVAARALESLGALAWRMDIEVALDRQPPMAYSDGDPIPEPIRQRGRLALREGRGEYFRFPYPLHDVSGSLSFEGEEVRIEAIRGKGPTGADVLLQGDLLLPEGDAAVDLRITSPNLPTDEYLEQALDEGPRALIGTLFDRAAHGRLAELGLLATADSILEDEFELGRLSAELRGMAADDDRRPGLERISDRLSRRIAAGPFDLGGPVAIDLRIEQGLGKGAPIYTTGNIRLTRSGVMVKGFPYPLTVIGGEIMLEDERIWFGGDGSLPFLTAGGGYGRISGEIGIPRREQGRGFEPRLRIVAADDTPGPTLLACIPEPEWIVPFLPAETTLASGWADLLAASGSVDLAGEVLPDSSGGLDPDWRFTAQLEAVTARPSPPLVSAIRELGLEWPAELAIEGIEGELMLEPGLVEFEGLEGWVAPRGEPSPLLASGVIRPRESSLDVTLQARGLDAATWFAASEAVEPPPPSMWIRRGVEGRIDATVRARRGVAGFERTLELDGGFLEIDGSWLTEPRSEGHSPRIRLDLASGLISFERGGVTFRRSSVELSSGDQPLGRLDLDGGRPQADAPWELQIDWRNGRLESAATSAAIAEFLPEIEPAWKSFEPRGGFDFDLRLDPAAAPALTLAVDEASANFGDSRLVVDSVTPTRIEVSERRVNVHQSRLEIGEGDDRGTATLSATFDRRADPRLSLTGDFELPRLPSPALAVLPEGIRESLVELAVTSDGPVRVTDLGLECMWPQSDEVTPSALELAGTIEAEAASIDAGLRFSEIDAKATIEASYTTEAPLKLKATINATRAVALDRELLDTRTTLEFDQRTGLLNAESIQGRLYGGLLEASVESDLGSGRYRLELLCDEIDAGLFIAGIPGADDPTPEPGGRLRGRLALEGDRDPAKRIGRGRLGAEDARLARDPMSMVLLQLSQLMLPINDAIADADVSFYIEGDRLVLDEVLLACDTMSFSGGGEVDLDQMTVSSRFTARGRVPGVSDLLAPIAGMLYAIDLEGPLKKPEASLHPLPGLAPPTHPKPSLTRGNLDSDR